MSSVQLFPHQVKVLEETRGHNRVGYFMDMGLGKTFVASEKAVELGSKEILVVCQKSKISDWEEHFETYYDLDVTVINYELIWRRPELLNRSWETVILDESSLLQNPQAKRTKAILKMKMQNVILLSGTVINGAYEKIVSQLGLLGCKMTKKDFYRNFVVTRPWEPAPGVRIDLVVGYKQVDKLKTMMRDYGGVWMRTTDSGVKLPEQVHTTITVPASPEYRKFHKTHLVTVDGDELFGDTLLTERLYKRQLCGAYSKAKQAAFRDFLESTDGRVCVFYQFDKELEVLKKICEELKRPISVVNGSEKDLTAYEDQEESVSLLQYQSASFGLNLQKSNVMAFYTLPDGQAEQFQQAMKRIHRIGATKTCFYYTFQCENTIEEEIAGTLQQKTGRIERMFD